MTMSLDWTAMLVVEPCDDVAPGRTLENAFPELRSLWRRVVEEECAELSGARLRVWWMDLDRTSEEAFELSSYLFEAIEGHGGLRYELLGKGEGADGTLLESRLTFDPGSGRVRD